jgi:hypothetical protein
MLCNLAGIIGIIMAEFVESVLWLFLLMNMITISEILD